MKGKNYNISEEDFLKNKAKRKAAAEKSSGRKNKKKKSSRSPVLNGFLIALAVLAGIILLAVVTAAVYYFAVIYGDGPDSHNDKNDNFINSEGLEVNRITSEDGAKKYFTFLATATDKGGSLTDVIMVARFHYDDDEPAVSILQIPRDTYVKVASDKLYFTKDGALSSENFTQPTAKTSIKINEAYYRGRNLAQDTVSSLLKEVDGKPDSEIEKILKEKKYVFLEADEKKVKQYAKADDEEKSQIEKDILRDFGLTYLQNLIYYDFGIPTDYRAQVNIKGFRGIVNAIDGVDLYISRPMHYDDPYQDLHIHFDPGQHHLDGKKAEEFVRFRGYPEGDVARLDAQKQFINAFLDKLLSFKTFSRIDEITTEVKENLYTDVSFNNMLKFANKMLNMDLKNDVHTYTLPGVGEYIGPVSYFVADRDEIIKLVNEEFNVYSSPLIDEDFKIIDDEKIYRPASVVTDTPEQSGDGNEEDEETRQDGEDGEDSENNEEDEDLTDEENQDGEADNRTESGNGENGDDDDDANASDNAENDGEASSADDNDDVGVEEPTDTRGEQQNGNSSSDNGGDDNDGSGNENESSADSGNASTAVDENYQLLLEMQEAA